MKVEVSTSVVVWVGPGTVLVETCTTVEVVSLTKVKVLVLSFALSNSGAANHDD